MSVLDYGIVAAYLIGMLLLGVYFRDNDSEEDYFLGGRSFGWFPVGLSVLATQLSAVSFISVPAFVGARVGGGMAWTSTELHAPLTMLVLMVVLIPPLYRANVISIYGFLEQRLGPSTRTIVGATFLVNRALATGMMTYAVCLLLNEIIGISFVWSLVFVGVITIIYSWQGGMRAVIYGDAIQMIVLFSGILACLYFGWQALGGWEAWRASLDPARAVALDFSSLGIGGDGDFGFWPLLIGGLFISVAYYGTDQSEAQRLLSSRDVPTLRRTLLFVGMTRYPVIFMYSLVGLVIGPLLLGGESTAELAEDPDRLIPIFMATYLPSGIVGLLVVAILASAMSSLSSAVNSLSAVTVEDYLPRFTSVEGRKRTVLVSRLATIGWGAIILTVASLAGRADETIVVVIAQIGSISFGPILGVFLLAILSPRTTARAANVGLLAGIALNLFLWLGVGDDLFWIWWNVTGFVLSFGLGHLLSRGRPAPSDNHKLDVRPDWAALRSREAVILLIWFVLMLGVSYYWPIFVGGR